VRWLPCLFGVLLLTADGSHAMGAKVVTMKSGHTIEGEMGVINKIGEDPFKSRGGKSNIKTIAIFDDQLRRVFVRRAQIDQLRDSLVVGTESIKLKQRVATNSPRLVGIGSIHSIYPFDGFGRRRFNFTGVKGRRADVMQGITEITPTWTKVEGLSARTPFTSYTSDMRIATSSIPRAQLSTILQNHLDFDNEDDRMKVVRLLMSALRYKDALEELRLMKMQFPNLISKYANLSELERGLEQSRSLQILDEIEERQRAGQHQFVHGLLSSFPRQNVANETTIRVQDMLDDYAKKKGQRDQVVALFNRLLVGLEDEALKQRILPIGREIANELSVNTLLRMADFLRLADAAALGPEEKMSLAVSGWLLGTGAEKAENLNVSLSLIEVRSLVRRYLVSKNSVERTAILAELASQEGATPGNLARLLLNMKPPVETKPQPGSTPGLFELSVPALTGDERVRYLVQLPINYDPYRRYPTVVTLHAEGTTPDQQIDWWAGQYNAQAEMRLGQATRHGYIVIAPTWKSGYSRKYAYSAREHAAVLNSLRDAMGRFSIDADRVFLSGHSAGGEAAWDIGLAHPDLWAGVIPIGARWDKYIGLYWGNSRYVPLYFVQGEFDGTKRTDNAPQYDRYLGTSHIDATIVMYQGRGHEHFIDEIHRLFEWMDIHKRDFFPSEFECSLMRKWDSFFWWVELKDIPARNMVSPIFWGSRDKSIPPAMIDASRNDKNNVIKIRTGAKQVTVWLSPDVVDMDKRVKIISFGSSRTIEPKASIRVLLEDARTRGDRQHPFWARVVLKGRK